jgi:hypothetical protein
MIGGVCLFFALAGFIDWAVFKFGGHVKMIREAWKSPQLDYARAVSSMNRDQLRVFEHTAVFESISYLGNTGRRDMLYTPTMNIPFTFVAEYLNDCASTYPYLKPQHGMPDALKRDYVQAFTRLMVANGLADKPLGNKPAKWLRPLSDVEDILFK